MEHWDMPNGFAWLDHTYHREDESFWMLEGEIVFVFDGARGKFRTAFESSAASMLILCKPPAPPEMNRLMRRAGEYGTENQGPLPDGTGKGKARGGTGPSRAGA